MECSCQIPSVLQMKRHVLGAQTDSNCLRPHPKSHQAGIPMNPIPPYHWYVPRSEIPWPISTRTIGLVGAWHRPIDPHMAGCSQHQTIQGGSSKFESLCSHWKHIVLRNPENKHTPSTASMMVVWQHEQSQTSSFWEIEQLQADILAWHPLRLKRLKRRITSLLVRLSDNLVIC